RPGGDTAPAHDATAGRRPPLARADGQPGRPRGGHAPEHARRRPEPQLAGRLEAERRSVGRLLLWAAADVGAREPGDARLHPARQAGADDLVPPAARRRPRLRSARRRAEALRAPDRTAVPPARRAPAP